MVYHLDCARFFADGELRSKNHARHQTCHQTSYPQIVGRRGGRSILTPNGRVINDHVAFYFSPLTGMAFTIHRGNVTLVDPQGRDQGPASMTDRVFFVAGTENFRDAGLAFCFSDVACNSNAPLPRFSCDLDALETHVAWDVFDEAPTAAHIPEIGYHGCTTWQHDKDDPPRYQNRRRKRMAEFLVEDAVPLALFSCIIAQNDRVAVAVRNMMVGTAVDLPVLVKPGCYYR